MKTMLITGSAGLIGSAAAEFFVGQGYQVVGIDNDMRSRFFGPGASTRWNRERLTERLGSHYTHVDADIRNRADVEGVFRAHATSLRAIIHTAAQPSHDWAASDPCTDFSVNATATLNLLELTRHHCPDVPFLFTSTNKVYGDAPNRLPLISLPVRFELPPSHPFYQGIDESMPIDQSLHSLFGVSKVAADVMTQEYGRYFGMPTVCFRGGCLTGENHSGAEQHGFLSYLMRCAVTGVPYTVYGHGGRQVRDNIHSRDLVLMFDAFIKSPAAGRVYNAGGSRACNCSVREAIALCEAISGNRVITVDSDQARLGDHKWWISSTQRFQADYPSWTLTWSLRDILQTIHDMNRDRWKQHALTSGAGIGAVFRDPAVEERPEAR